MNKDIPLPKILGWSLFIIRCADDTYFTGMARDIRKELIEIRTLKKGLYFNTHPERFPIELMYKEGPLPFLEAYAKFRYLRKMNKTMKKRLIKKKKWPIAGPYREYLIKYNIEL